MKAVRMKFYLPGMMGGVTLPRANEVVTLSDVDADLLVARGFATLEPVEVPKILPAPANPGRKTK